MVSLAAPFAGVRDLSLIKSSLAGCRRRLLEGQGHILDNAPPSEGTSLQRRSGMARVVEGFHDMNCTNAYLSTNGMNHTCLCLPSQSWSSFNETEGMEG